MNQNSPRKNKKKFIPLMLTSKSMHPVTRNQKLDQIEQQIRDNNSQLIYQYQNQDFMCSSNFHTPQLRQNYHQQQPQCPKQFNQLKIHTYKKYQPLICNSQDNKLAQAILKLPQFRGNYSRRQTYEFKSKLINYININEISLPKPQTLKDKRKTFFSQTESELWKGSENMKASEQMKYTKLAHRRPKKQSSSQQHFDNYLKIRKVDPMTDRHKMGDFAQLSPQKSLIISEKVDEIIKKHQKRYSVLHQHHTSLHQKRKAPPHSKIPKRTLFKLENRQDKQFIKIKQNLKIIAQNIKLPKKQYFVFGFQNSYRKSGYQTNNNHYTKFYIYRDFIFRINFTNGLYVTTSLTCQKPYIFYSGKGNNSQLLKGILRRRTWWRITQKQDFSKNTEINFVWTQLKQNKFMKQLKKIMSHSQKVNIMHQNHFFRQDGNINLHGQIQDIQQDEKNDKKIMIGQDLQLWLNYMEKNKKIQQRYPQKAYQKRHLLLNQKDIKLIENSNQLRIHNHFQHNQILGNKKALFYYLRRYYLAIGVDSFTKIPLTFHVSRGVDDPEYTKFIKIHDQLQKNKNKLQMKNIWIMKPGEYTNRGKGITVCSSLDDIKERLKGKERNPFNNRIRTFIIQKYMEKPLLYKKRKFDIRHYMLMTCFNGQIKGYWYEEGYLRTTSNEYCVKNTKNIYTHLTNDAIQKYSPDYGKYQKGNKLTYSQFQKYLQEQNITKYNFFTHTIPKMKSLALDAMRATFKDLCPNRQQYCFQLFGLDYMMDQNFDVYLIQVNTNPCLQTNIPLLTRIISNLIQNVYKICIDPFFPPPIDAQNNTKKFPFGDNTLQQNKFQLIFDEKIEGAYLQILLKDKFIGTSEMQWKTLTNIKMRVIIGIRITEQTTNFFNYC